MVKGYLRGEGERERSVKVVAGFLGGWSAEWFGLKGEWMVLGVASMYGLKLEGVVMVLNRDTIDPLVYYRFYSVAVMAEENRVDMCTSIAAAEWENVGLKPLYPEWCRRCSGR